jgi:hypothetical protein
MKKIKSKVKKPARVSKRRVRTVALITGLKQGDPNKLAPHQCLMANVAYECGEVCRADYLAALKEVITTVQPIGRLFSFHKPTLIKGGYIRFKKVPRDAWLESQAKAEPVVAPAAVSRPVAPPPPPTPQPSVEPPAVTPPPAVVAAT